MSWNFFIINIVELLVEPSEGARKVSWMELLLPSDRQRWRERSIDGVSGLWVIFASTDINWKKQRTRFAHKPTGKKVHLHSLRHFKPVNCASQCSFVIEVSSHRWFKSLVFSVDWSFHRALETLNQRRVAHFRNAINSFEHQSLQTISLEKWAKPIA